MKLVHCFTFFPLLCDTKVIKAMCSILTNILFKLNVLLPYISLMKNTFLFHLPYFHDFHYAFSWSIASIFTASPFLIPNSIFLSIYPHVSRVPFPLILFIWIFSLLPLAQIWTLHPYPLFFLLLLTSSVISQNHNISSIPLSLFYSHHIQGCCPLHANIPNFIHVPVPSILPPLLLLPLE